MLEFAPKSKTPITYEEAIMYCFLCTYDGHKDWRLPVVPDYHTHGTRGWHQGDRSHFGNLELVSYVTPVRDL